MNGDYDLLLVARSLAVGVIASFAAFELARRAGLRRSWTAAAWLACAAALMGSGIWTLHFNAMLAMRFPDAMTFHAVPTAYSFVIAVAGSAVALVVARHVSAPRGIALGAALMGSGIAGMHYTAMGALATAQIGYRPALAAASVAVAIGGAFAALWLALRVRQRSLGRTFLAKVGGAILMGGAIGAMHYVGMTATTFHQPAAIAAAGALDRDAIAMLLALATLVIVAATLCLAALDAHEAASGLRLTSSLRSANQQLRDLALHDSLTGLPNRMLLDDRLEQAATRSRRTGKPFAFLFLDLDRFKPVNDSLGHGSGDALLIAVARRLLGCVRKPDTVARTGGDEFAVVLSEIEHPADAGLVSAKILDELSRPFFLGADEVSISGSIGITVYPADGCDIDALRANADAAMYLAKREGRGAFRYYIPGMVRAAA